MVDNLINERIAKKIASSGLCSRREAERLINNGCVKLNGNVIKNCNTNVTTKDIIEVNDQKLKEKERVRLWLYYKKKGFLVTTKDTKGRPNIFDEIPARGIIIIDASANFQFCTNITPSKPIKVSESLNILQEENGYG